METSIEQYLEYKIQTFYDDVSNWQNEDHYVSDDRLEMVYAVGYYCFTYGKFGVAKDIFASLTAYASYMSHYWRALGATNQQLKNYADAIAAYDMAIANDEYEVVSYVYRGESKILSGDIEGGLQDFSEVLQIGTFYLEFEPWVKRAELLLSLW